MSYWFQRNCLKATTVMSFETSMIAQEFEALKISNDLKGSRARLLELLPNPNHDVDTLEAAYKSYLSLLTGLIFDPERHGQPSKLRNNFLFKWTHTLLGNVPELCQDTAFEAANITCNFAIWYMKHASMIAGKDAVTMDEAKEAHTALRKAAGAFTFVKDTLMPLIVDRQKDGGDLDKRVLVAYIKQCTGEAQEVTVARAIELKHNPSLISALANETSTLFRDGAIAIQSIPEANQWKLYFQLKEAFYRAYAYNYFAENLLTLDRCGEAISALRESQKEQAKTGEISKEYTKIKGPGRSAKPEKHPFFRRLAPLVKFTLEKCERENGFIYHQKVPAEPPELELKATYGLVSPEQFTLPAPSPLWTPVTYAAFQPKLASAKDPANSNAAAKAAGELPPVKEAKIHQTTNEHDNNSGCVLQ